MDKWMGEWMNGCMDGWMDERESVEIDETYQKDYMA